MKKEMTFDIEAIPCQQPGILDEFRNAVTAPAQFKKPESIAAWMAENRDAEAEAAWLKTSFDGGLGQVVCIGFAVNEADPMTYVVSDLSPASERRLLEDFFSLLTDFGAGTRLIGHNHIAFDIPFIWKRAIVHGIRPPACFPRAPKPWSELVFDTMVEWAGAKDRISMNKLCRILGIEDKGGMDGSKVWPMVQEGRLDEVADYCRGDVERTRAMYRRMTFADVVCEKPWTEPTIKTLAPKTEAKKPAAAEVPAADF